MRRCINEGSDELLFDFEGLVQFPRTFCAGLGKMTSVGAYRATVSSERNMYVRKVHVLGAKNNPAVKKIMLSLLDCQCQQCR